MTSPDFALPFTSEEERNEQRSILQALASHLANLESMAAQPSSSWSAEDMATVPRAQGDEGISISSPGRLARWADHHADDLAQVRHLAASSGLTDADLRRGVTLAEGALAALLGITVAEMAERIRSDAGKGLRTPTSSSLGSAAPPEPEEAAGATSLPIMVRPKPDEQLARVRAKGDNKGWIERRIDPSDSWWEKGGLLVDERGPALVDADGVRHPFPAAARGGFLVRATITVITGGGGRPAPDLLLFVAAPPDQGQQVLLRLPRQGFGFEVERSELDAFAHAAALTYVRSVLTSSAATEFPGLGDAPSLEWAIHDRASRDRSGESPRRRMGERVRHLFENRDGR